MNQWQMTVPSLAAATLNEHAHIKYPKPFLYHGFMYIFSLLWLWIYSKN